MMYDGVPLTHCGPARPPRCSNVHTHGLHDQPGEKWQDPKPKYTGGDDVRE